MYLHGCAYARGSVGIINSCSWVHLENRVKLQNTPSSSCKHNYTNLKKGKRRDLKHCKKAVLRLNPLQNPCAKSNPLQLNNLIHSSIIQTMSFTLSVLKKLVRSIITVFNLAKLFAAVLRCVCQASGMKLCTYKPLRGVKKPHKLVI